MLGGVPASRGRSASWGVCFLGGVGIPACTEADPPVNRITDTSKNITLATTSLRPVIKLLQNITQMFTPSRYPMKPMPLANSSRTNEEWKHEACCLLQRHIQKLIPLRNWYWTCNAFFHTWHLHLCQRQRHCQSLTLHQWWHKCKHRDWVWIHSLHNVCNCYWHNVKVWW